jgi:hypothetical protein
MRLGHTRHTMPAIVRPSSDGSAKQPSVVTASPGRLPHASNERKKVPSELAYAHTQLFQVNRSSWTSTSGSSSSSARLKTQTRISNRETPACVKAHTRSEYWYTQSKSSLAARTPCGPLVTSKSTATRAADLRGCRSAGYPFRPTHWSGCDPSGRKTLDPQVAIPKICIPPKQRTLGFGK